MCAARRAVHIPQRARRIDKVPRQIGCARAAARSWQMSRVAPTGVHTRRRSELHLQGLPTERDSRPVAKIVEAAAASASMPEAAAALLKVLAEHGITQAWQLELADADDWRLFGARVGMKIAVKAELAQHNTPAASVPSSQEIDIRVRHFLLMPGPNGAPPKRLRTLSAPFLSLLLVKTADRQGLMLKTFKLTGLISGLLMPIPVSLLRFVAARDEAQPLRSAASSIWSVPFTVDGWMDALAAFTFFNLSLVAITCIMLAMFTVSSGWHATTQYYRELAAGLVPCSRHATQVYRVPPPRGGLPDGRPHARVPPVRQTRSFRAWASCSTCFSSAGSSLSKPSSSGISSTRRRRAPCPSCWCSRGSSSSSTR